MTTLAVAAGFGDEAAKEKVQEIVEELTTPEGTDTQSYYSDPNAQPDWSALRASGLLKPQPKEESTDAAKANTPSSVPGGRRRARDVLGDV